MNPAIVALRDVRLTMWKEQMDKSDSVRLLMSSKYAQISNYWKYFIGQTEQLKHLKVVDEKEALEKQFTDWAKDKPQYASILPAYQKAYEDYNKYALHQTYMKEGITGSTLIAQAYKYMGLEKALMANPQKPEDIKKAEDALTKDADDFYKSFNVISEEKILAQLTQMYSENIPADQQPEYMAKLMKKFKGKTPKETFEKFAAAAFKKSFITTKKSALDYLAKADLKTLQKDPAFEYAKAFYDNYTSKIKPHIDEFNAINNAQGILYIKALMEMQPNKNFYPDANGTLRLTYGSVKSYHPKDGVDYKYYTTLAGVMEKENPKDFEFTVPAKLKELFQKKDFGQYADANGEMHTDFISNNDITGGNSGSPVMNANGELVGLAFDGNWEAMSGDIFFDSKYKRTISEDIRYVLFLIDKFGGATNLINEMKIVK